MINNTELEILKCPVSGNPLNPVSKDLLDELNTLIGSKKLFYYNGELVLNGLEEILIDSSDSYYYEVKEGIYLLLKNLAILNPTRSELEFTELNDAEKINLTNQKFYDEFGWNKKEDNFIDGEKWEDLRPITKNYRHKCHLKLNRHLGSGKYLVDVASGTIQYDEYLTYSENFEYRICIDISIKALLQAREKIGTKGIFILGDITNIPLANDTVDGVISLHTIYHIPKEIQITAFEEIHRVLKPQKQAAIIYSWGNNAPMMKFFRRVSAVLELIKTVIKYPLQLVGLIKKNPTKKVSDLERKDKFIQLYFHSLNYKWLSKSISFEMELYSWRSTSVVFLKRYIRGSFLGKPTLKLIYFLEEQFPKKMGKIGQYPLFIIKKK